ncbi:MAG: thiopurine S-methyltransferase [Pseudomonadota bacterium]
MEASFWHERWTSGRIAFHEGAPNALLVKHWPALGMGRRVFVPLCGKAVDLIWLAAQGHEVVGAELDPIAVEAFYAENGLTPTRTKHGELTLFEAGEISIWQGDIFALTAEMLGSVDAVFDRAALVALPSEMRVSYAAHCTGLAQAAPQLLITYEYANPAMKGPPHSVPADEVRAHYASTYDVRELERCDISGPLTTRTSGTEAVYHLARKAD